jgi:ubiquinol-cytochrome c reductase iron-sulfur subunit
LVGFMNETVSDLQDSKRRGFLQLACYLTAGIGAITALVPFLRYMLPSERAKVLGDPLEVDVSNLAAGELRTVEWRGRPIWLLRRTREMLASLPEMTPHLLDSGVDPDYQPAYVDPEKRSIKPELLVVEAVCTHLGCVPVALPTPGDPAVGDWWRGGFLCPCHRSAYDYAGRVVQGPAPKNLAVPKYHFLDSEKVVIGVDPIEKST